LLGTSCFPARPAHVTDFYTYPQSSHNICGTYRVSVPL
jgi:hypothetical protein